jgi:phosphomannomutase
MPLDDLHARAEQWILDDPDPGTRQELRALLDVPRRSPAQQADLEDRFAGPLDFGTAGLRGVLGAGPNRMNRAVVARATWALARVLIDTVPGAVTRGVVVGCDARRMSPELAEDAAAIVAAAGLRVVLFSWPVPTPVVGFAVKRLGAAAGVVVTASHNPRDYNGYKVYWANAAQIVPPVDAAIAAAIGRAPPACEVERPGLGALRAAGRVAEPPADIEDAYLQAIRDLAVHPSEGDRTLRIVYTPLHGVGDRLARRALASAGFSDVTSVPEQREPDGAFPTVAFPNPEEPGAMDLALHHAHARDADLVLANDPDADRLAVSERIRGGQPVAFGSFSGNHVGVLLGHYLLTERPPSTSPKGRAVLATIVSSPLLGRIARDLGAHYEETLTGFKWIANRAIELEAEGYEFLFGFEEALGYCIGGAVRDKDGISAAVLAAELAAVLRARGATLATQLDAIRRRWGVSLSAQINVTRPGASGAAAIAALMDQLRTRPPAHFAGDEVVTVIDYAKDSANHTAAAHGQPVLPRRLPRRLPRSNVLAFHLASGARFIARPSGTEPKAKLYFDVPGRVATGESLEATSERALAALQALKDAVVAELALGQDDGGRRP